MGLLFTRSALATECKNAEDIPLNPGILKLYKMAIATGWDTWGKDRRGRVPSQSAEAVVSKGRFHLKADLEHGAWSKAYHGGTYNLDATITDPLISC